MDIRPISSSALARQQTMHPESVPISSEPLIRALHRRTAEIALAVYGAMVAYVSFVPFDVTTHPSARSGPGWVWGLRVTGVSIADIFSNIGFYLPLGALGFIVLRRRRIGLMRSGGLAVLFAAALSLAVEHGQHWIASRIPSWIDVTTNTLGAWLGVMIVGGSAGEGRRLLTRARDSARQNWLLAVAKVAVCGVLLIQLRPYDVVVDLYHTAAAVRHADLGPMARWNALPAALEADVQRGRRSSTDDVSRLRWEYALDRATDVAIYAGLTLLLALGLAPQFRRRRGRMLAWIGFVVVSLATMVALIRIFLISHGLDTAHVYCGLAGWLIGCILVLRTRSTPKQVLPNNPATLRPSHRGLQHAAMATALTLCILYGLVPFDFGTRSAGASNVAALFGQVPFAAQFMGRPNDAFYDITGKLLRYGTIGVCLALLFFRHSRWSWRRQLLATTLITGAIGLIIQAVHLTMASRHADTTTLLLALAAGFSGCVAVRWAHDYRRSLSILPFDDPLTSQLVDGPTYDKSALTALRKPHSDASPKDRVESGRPD